jgi:hypothetical protein
MCFLMEDRFAIQGHLSIIKGLKSVYSSYSLLKLQQTMLYLPYELSDSKIVIKFKKIQPLPLFSFSILSLLFHISFIHPISLPSSFCISPHSFAPLFHFATSIPHVLYCLSLLIAYSASSFLSFHPILFSLSSFPHLNLAFIFLSCTLSPQVLRNFLCHTPLILPTLIL